MQEQDVVATLRPPANEAHYHNPQSSELFDARVEFLSQYQETKLVVLPRNDTQATDLKKRWPGLFKTGAMLIPSRVVDGINLNWYSDLVLSGGGKMNREAAALSVPVYSVFRGSIGAVDRYLSEQGRLVLLETVEDIRTKIRIEQRSRPSEPQARDSATLTGIVDQIIKLAERRVPLSEVRDRMTSPTVVAASNGEAGEFETARTAK